MGLNLLKQNKSSRIAFQLGLVFGIVQIALLFYFWRRLPPQLPLFYSRPWGEEQLTSPLVILILPGLSIAIVLINLAINVFIAPKEILMRQIISITAAVFSLLCLITLAQIVRLVI